MTNYNERLDEIFAPLIDSPSLTLTTAYWDEAKQAILDWHNKQVEEVLDRLKAGISADIPNYYDQDGWGVAMKHIKAERAKLKGSKL